MNKIALGTVQFGLNHGISNLRGRIPQEEVFAILKSALSNGIDTLDTAYCYGDSESVIGNFLSSHNHNFKISLVRKICGLKQAMANRQVGGTEQLQWIEIV